ncbi:hypothetical protein IFU23_23545 [Pantoea agglomerans]|uniref:Uncharacterized protein n=1 Tax=Enterobacter agglomerans TaxID=549 RepID=A0ACC5PUL9_ENTAG|nr:hypothetical protein [Pantoea agglomerans]MBD8128881.1 hypothetical protein [Pantoea agglomerans]MBD8156266.1 hypothetical protein [Pantoea agglomerans]MBD8161065.1 hypothetical protein [Pantoea agglomerans]MBD8234543.1 hypothetical protein [Pantoea agglomerans]MBD8245009.1 hypothetical protein [Pantoea agglomerans]
MTTRDNGGPGKARHLNNISACCEAQGMRVICVNAAERDSGSGMGVTKQHMARVFLAKSDVSRIKALYSGEDGERLAEAVRNNCSVWFPLNPGGNGNDA